MVAAAGTCDAAGFVTLDCGSLACGGAPFLEGPVWAASETVTASTPTTASFKEFNGFKEFKEFKELFST